MFGQDVTCPVLLKERDGAYPYGAITRYGPAFQPVPVASPRSLAWSAFARRY